MRTYRPDYVTTADHSWLATVIQTYVQSDGMALHKVHSRLSHIKIPNTAASRYRRAIRFLDKQVSDQNVGFSAREIRIALFSAIFKMNTPLKVEDLERILKSVSVDLGIEKQLLSRSLLSDIEGEQIVNCEALSQDLYETANEINLVLAKSLLHSASMVTIHISDNSRRVVRQAKLKGLICTAVKKTNGLELTVSGPLSLLHKTKMYGHGLASMLDSVVWCETYELLADCRLSDDHVSFSVKSGDPLRPGKRPKAFDSRLEEKFAVAAAKKLPNWRLIREPEPIETLEGVIFPDFLVENISDPKMRFFCEIVGFWTRDYIERKMRQWASVRDARFVLCIDEKLKVEDEVIPDGAPVYFFKSSIDPQEVLDLAFSDGGCNNYPCI